MKNIPMGAAAALALALSLGGCTREGHQAPENVVNVYSWPIFIAPDTVANFERETGIKVNYDTFETDEVQETKLLVGHSNYDVVVPGDLAFERELHAGVFRKLDKAALPNLVNLDPQVMSELARHDPGNLYAIPYSWTTTGLAYDVDKVRERLGSSEFDSWSLLFDPANAARLADCGITIIDSPTDVFPTVLYYLGKDPNRHDLKDLDEASDVLMRIRPFVRWIVSVGNVEGVSRGERCLALNFSGDMAAAGFRAAEARNGVVIRYFIPREGSYRSIDAVAIPADAPHPQNALKWLNYLMRPDVMAAITNTTKFPNGNRAALPLVDEAIKHNPAVYPDAEAQGRLHTLTAMPPDYLRHMTRLWTTFRTGS
ncbi:MAG: polyamine ABC transporter substrate-binding protein [Steroidobacteraceae bacterium]